MDSIYYTFQFHSEIVTLTVKIELGVILSWFEYIIGKKVSYFLGINSKSDLKPSHKNNTHNLQHFKEMTSIPSGFPRP